MILKKKIDEDTQIEINQLVLSIADLDKQNKKLKNIIDSKDKKIDELKERLSIYESDNDTVVMTNDKWEETKQEVERLTKRLEESQLAFLQVDKERQRLNDIINETREDLYQVVKWCTENKHNENTIERYLVVDYGTIVGKVNEIRTKLDLGSDKE